MRSAPRHGWSIRRALIFVAVVWGVTGSFIAVEIAGQAAFTTLRARFPAIRARTLAPAVLESTTCRGGAAAAPVPGAVRAAAWSLGVAEGSLAQARMMVERSARVSDAARQLLQSMTETARAGAAALQVPASTFVPEYTVNANSEFVGFVERSETARQLGAAYSPTVCHLYTLGAYWGYSLMPRTAVPGIANIFAAEIEHHARAAGLAESLWAPLTAPTSGSASGEALAAEGDALTAAITASLAGTP
jgi:hypothetical protein